MRYGIGSGALWGLDTVILAIALALNPFATDAHVMVAALLGGPIGMSGYLLAIDQIGAGYTAIISTF